MAGGSGKKGKKGRKVGRNKVKCQNYAAKGTRERNKKRRADKRAKKLAKAKEKREAKQANASRFSAIWGHERSPA